MATTVSFISEKGGVGKTTACYHIAVALNRYHEKRVLVVDADYQRGGISGRFFPTVIERFSSGQVPGTTLFHKFQQLYSASSSTPKLDVETWSDSRSFIDVVVADPRLSTITIDKLPSSNNIRQNNRQIFEHIEVIRKALKEIDNEYDYILIDSHPEVSDVLRSVIYAADFCVSPVKLDRQSSIGVATILGEINNVNSDVDMLRSSIEGIEFVDTEFAGSMGMMAREWAANLKQSEQVEFNRLKRTGGVFTNYVTEGDGLRLAAQQRVPVYDISIANAEKQSEQFRDLTTEFVMRCP
ncbi:MAG: ParA family protein [Mesorhizobium sp.]|nr:MAG: ParA family protein [Mesorhizobium sp.]TKC02198.1 MAG: ParA family protein [Mesorhizobium sp.]